MNLDLQDAQRSSILKMLDLKSLSDTTERRYGGVPQWKVLVYDKYCQDIIAPLLKVGQLRSHGVTLHLSLASKREKVLDVPVIYFVEPTRENVDRMVADFRAGLYSSIHVNFSSSISSELLGIFAKEIGSSITSSSPSQISKVIDRYCSFVSLSSLMYSLNLKSTYLNLHRAGVTDSFVESMVDQVSESLMSLILTGIKQVPVIRAPQNDASAMIAERLNDNLSKFLKTSVGRELLSSNASISSDPSHAQRPLLVILDRDMDLGSMLGHGWSYAGLLTDLLGMTLNKVSLPKENKSFDIDVSDSFWKKVAHIPFPDAATAVNEHVNEFNRKRQAVTSETSGLSTSAISALPQITEMKKIVDMHTTLATTLLNEIKRKGTDKFYEAESNGDLNLFLTEIVGNASFDITDKVRTGIVLALRNPQKMDTIEKALSGAAANSVNPIVPLGGSPSGNTLSPTISSLKYIKYMQSLRMPSAVVGSTIAGSTNQVPQLSGVLGGLAEKFKSRSETLIAQGMRNLKSILPNNDNLIVTNLVQQLADQVANPLTDSFLYLDPKNPGTTLRVKGSYRQVIVCVVGGGSMVEFENLVIEWGKKTNRTVLYGATDFPQPTTFLNDLAQLAQ